jgi:hypothetical protein
VTPPPAIGPAPQPLAPSAALLALVLWQAACARSAAMPADPLPSWNEGPTKAAILDFVERTTRPAARDFIPLAERIATFDNDGTLWPEQPVVQGAFVLSRVKAQAEKDPTLKQREPFKALLEGNVEAVLAGGEPALMEIMAATSANMTDDQFERDARRFLETARHPKLGARYTALAYRPMVELLGYLRSQGFKTFICSGGGADFMRLVSEQMYGVPPEQVIGSGLKKELRHEGGQSALWRMPAVGAVNDKEAKPLNIDLHIGKRPVLAAGNVRSGGDIAMLEYSDERGQPSLQLMINHDDAVREFVYREKDDASLEAARGHGWHVVSIKDDWRTVFSPR